MQGITSGGTSASTRARSSGSMPGFSKILFTKNSGAVDAQRSCADVGPHELIIHFLTSFPVGKLTILTLFSSMGKLTLLIGLVMFSQLTYPVGNSCGNLWAYIFSPQRAPPAPAPA